MWRTSFEKARVHCLTEVRILLELDSPMLVFLISLLIFHFVWILDIDHVFDCRNKNKQIR